MTDRPRVAINAQIDPGTAGGVESSVTAIMQYYRDNPDQMEMIVLALPEFMGRFGKVVGDKHRVTRWDHSEERPIMPGSARGWWKRLERASGPGRPLLDAASQWLKLRVLEYKLGSPGRNDAELRSLGADAVHFPYGSTFPTDLPYIYEPHDLQHRRHPEFFDPVQLQWRDRVYGDGCRNAAMVVCGSNWTKRDIMTEFGVPSKRIAVIPRSSRNVRAEIPAETSRRLREEAGLPDRFAYYPAMTFPHKNHIRLFEALALLRDRDGLVVPLVMSGRCHEPHAPALINALHGLDLEDQVQRLGVVSDEMLATLFRSAAFMAFPSLYEGVSQSLLEGLQVGLPMVVANQSCIPETVGPGALFFDGNDTEAMAAAIARAWHEPEMMSGLAALGREHYERYDWARGGPMLTAVYRHITGRRLEPFQQDLLDEALRD